MLPVMIFTIQQVLMLVIIPFCGLATTFVCPILPWRISYFIALSACKRILFLLDPSSIRMPNASPSVRFQPWPSTHQGCSPVVSNVSLASSLSVSSQMMRSLLADQPNDRPKAVLIGIPVCRLMANCGSFNHKTELALDGSQCRHWP